MVTRMLALAGEASGSVSAAVKREASTEAARQEPRGVWRKDILPKAILIPERILTPSIRSLSRHFGSTKADLLQDGPLQDGCLQHGHVRMRRPACVRRRTQW